MAIARSDKIDRLYHLSTLGFKKSIHKSVTNDLVMTWRVAVSGAVPKILRISNREPRIQATLQVYDTEVPHDREWQLMVLHSQLQARGW